MVAISLTLSASSQISESFTSLGSFGLISSCFLPSLCLTSTLCSGETVLLFLDAEEEDAMDMVSVAGDLPVVTEEESEDELSSGTS